jgi:hypothetical protein
VVLCLSRCPGRGKGGPEDIPGVKWAVRTLADLRSRDVEESRRFIMPEASGSGRIASRAVCLAAWLALALAASAMASQISLVSRAEPTLPNDAAGGDTLD